MIGPQVEAVLARGEPSWHHCVPLTFERNGYPEEAFFTWSHSAVTGEDGTVAGVLCVVHEETTSVRAERTLRDSERRYRAVVGALEEGVMVHDAAAAIVMAHPAAERILGLSLDQMRGLDSFDLRWRAVIRTGQPVSDVVFGIHRSDGTLVWVRPTPCRCRASPGPAARPASSARSST